MRLWIWGVGEGALSGHNTGVHDIGESIAADVDLALEVSASFLHYKVTVSFCVINRCGG